MSYTIAPSVRLALAEASRRWPNRSTASDGTIGDPAHSARVSDHNPDSRGVVHAFDLTHDPAHGVDCNVLAEQLRRRVLAGTERRVKYVIWNRRIFNPSVASVWRPYDGLSPHDHHMHVSILAGFDHENDVSQWWAAGSPQPPLKPRRQRTMFLVQHPGGVVELCAVVAGNKVSHVGIEDPADRDRMIAAGVPLIEVSDATWKAWTA